MLVKIKHSKMVFKLEISILFCITLKSESESVNKKTIRNFIAVGLIVQKLCFIYTISFYDINAKQFHSSFSKKKRISGKKFRQFVPLFILFFKFIINLGDKKQQSLHKCWKILVPQINLCRKVMQ